MLTFGSACAVGSGECTEIGCESVATVTYDGSVSGGYLLMVQAGGMSGMAECNAPPSPDAIEPPEWLSCDASSFEMVGAAADDNSVLVTIVLMDPDETVLIGNADVALPADPDNLIQPNGPDCEPTCFERRGTLQLPMP